MQVAALTAGAAVAALLIGPAVTWGLDIPVPGGSGSAVTQVAATAQGVVTTAEQTTRSAVTTVETAAPTTAAPVASAAPVVQTTVRAVTGQAVQKKAATGPVRNAPLTRVSAKTAPVRRSLQPTGGTGGSLRTAAPVAAVKAHVRSVTVAKPLIAASPRDRSSAPQAASSQCDSLPALPVLPGGLDVRALLAVVCNAAGNVLNPARIGTPGIASAGVSIGEVLGALGRSGSAPGARRAGPGSLRADAVRAAAASAGGYPGSSVAGATGWPGASGSAPSSAVGAPAGALSSRPTAADATRRADGARFSNRINGTALLSLVLILDAAFLAAIVLWRMARRWVVPRLA